jgi:hypothetical protein
MAASGRASTGDLFNQNFNANNLPPRPAAVSGVAEDYDQPTTVSDYPKPSPGVIKMEPSAGAYSIEVLK